jgi:putative protease
MKKKTKKTTLKKKVSVKKKVVKKAVAAKKKPVKRPVALKIKKEAVAGIVTHYFGNIKVAIIKLKTDLKKGDAIHCVGGSSDYKQLVGSMEIDHVKMNKAKKGSVIGIKVKSKIREGGIIYKT